MNTIRTLAHLLSRDLYERRESPSGRARYVEFDMGLHAIRIRREHDRMRRALMEIRDLTDATADAAPHIARRALEVANR